MLRMLRVLALSGVLSGVLTGCGPGYLDAGKKVPATDENRAVFSVLQRYQAAIENKDVDALRSLVSTRYHENAGTTDNATDDYGYDKLLQRLQMLRDNVKKVQLKLKLLDIQISGNEASADYEYFGRVLLSEGGSDSYRTWDDFKRMQLAREQGQWKIIGGL
jgi:ketosteroid isomerase-like protein